MFRRVPPSIIRSFSLYTQQWYMSYRFADSLVSRPVWHIPLLCVQGKTPDDGQRNCPKHVEFYSKNKFEKLVHLVGFIIRIVFSIVPCSIRTHLHMYKWLSMLETFKTTGGKQSLVYQLRWGGHECRVGRIWKPVKAYSTVYITWEKPRKDISEEGWNNYLPNAKRSVKRSMKSNLYIGYLKRNEYYFDVRSSRKIMKASKHQLLWNAQYVSQIRACGIACLQSSSFSQ
jgi:hypothetical protein